MSREFKSYPAAQRISKIICFSDAKIIQHRQYVPGSETDIVSVRIIKLVAIAMTSCIEKDQSMILLQGFHVSKFNPTFTAQERTVMKNEGRAATDRLVVYAHTLIVGEWHCSCPRERLSQVFSTTAA